MAKKVRPSLTPESQENQMVSMAMNLAAQQLADGTASSQIIAHFLKIGTTRERVEREILELKKDLVSAKTESLKAAARSDEIYANALSAMRDYSGHGGGDEDD